jgi:hypothetical protein
MSRLAFRTCRTVGCLLLTAVLLATAGCVLHPPGPHGSRCPAIEAATKIGFSDQRNQTLKRIAAGPELSQHEQSYLVNAIVEKGGFSDDVANALIAVIENPGCTDETRTQIARHVQCVGFDDGRQRVAEALAEARPTAKPTPG